MKLSPKYVNGVKLYPVTCIVCLHDNYFPLSRLQSMFQIFDSNKVRCEKCSTPYNLVFNAEEDILVIDILGGSK